MRILIGLILMLGSGPILAHALAPSMLHIQAARSSDPWVYPVLLRQDIGSSALQLIWPDSCRSTRVNSQRQARQIDRSFELSCSQSLDGQLLKVAGLNLRSSALLLRNELNANQHNQLISARNPQAVLGPGQDSIWLRYGQLGGAHILQGWDHLLLILGLFWLAGSARRMIGLATAFTLGHSLTLAAAALDLWRFPSAWVEVAIALSLLWMALRLARPETASQSRAEYPLIALFGLIHGMGFASSLMDIGLPESALLQALLAFNIGIEMGQILVLLSLAVSMRALKAIHQPLLPRCELISSYCIGSLAVVWLLERTPSLLN